MDIQVIAAILFVLFLLLFVYIKRKNIALQKIIFPLLYMIIYRSNFGIKFMNKVSKKYREIVKFFGYVGIGIGFLGMIFISWNIIVMAYNLITTPAPAAGVSLVLPFTNVPGIGYLSFFHWIIAIFILAVVHEFSHGIVAKAHGLDIKSSGFAFFAVIAPIIPAAFVEPDEKKIQKADPAVQYSIFAAGPMANILLALIIVIAMPFVINTSKLAPFEEGMTEPVGFSFAIIDNEEYPAIQSGMEAGIMKGINGEEITSYADFNDATYGLKPNEELTIITDTGEYTLTTAVSPDNPKRGFIGIVPQRNERVFKPEYKSYELPFNWFKELFRWLFLLNFFIGLFNLLPLGIVDGGRMLNTLLQSTVKNKKKATKVWGWISFFFLILILFGLYVSYFGNPFGFLF